MRAVLIGAGSSAVMTARSLLQRGHEVVIVDHDRERLDALSEELDCGFLHGDGSKPAILREADPQHTDSLFCLTDNDQANIIAALVGRSLGFRRVVVRIDDPEFEHICIELGLEDTIVPSRALGNHLADAFQGMHLSDLTVLVKDEARFFSFVAHGGNTGKVGDLDLPGATRVVCLYREDKFVPVEAHTKVEEGDEVVVVTHSKHMDELEERFSRTPGEE